MTGRGEGLKEGKMVGGAWEGATEGSGMGGREDKNKEAFQSQCTYQ